MTSDLRKLIDIVRKTTPDRIAHEITNVQPVPCISPSQYNLCKTEAELIKEGFKPVSSMGLMWIKKED